MRQGSSVFDPLPTKFLCRSINEEQAQVFVFVTCFRLSLHVFFVVTPVCGSPVFFGFAGGDLRTAGGD